MKYDHIPFSTEPELQDNRDVMAANAPIIGLSTGSSPAVTVSGGIIPNSQEGLLSLLREKDELIGKLQAELSKANVEIESLKRAHAPLNMPTEASQKELSARERQQLENLRKEIIEVKQQRANITKTAEELRKQVQQLQAKLGT